MFAHGPTLTQRSPTLKGPRSYGTAGKWFPVAFPVARTFGTYFIKMIGAGPITLAGYLILR